LLTGSSLLPWSAVGLAALPLPFAIAVAVLRHRLFDIDVVVNRTLVYGALTASVMLVYLAVTTLLGGVLPRDSFAATLLATGVAALAALPVRDLLQRGVNRLLYGDRDEPYRAITRLGERLSASLTTEEILPTVVATVASALRLPYAAIELRSGEVTSIAAATGDAAGRELTRLPLVDAGEAVGELIVAPRARGEEFSAADRRLLSGLAQEAGRAARSVRLVAEVERSRRQLVAAREEERRRLRRDLHDGLGPVIAGARLKAEAARDLTAQQAKGALELLGELDADLAGLLEEVRRIARALRPPVLDELGLLPALREQAANLARDARLELRVEGPDELPPLPAAVEAAAYWIALEALTNVRRHSGARHCAVRIRLADALELEVEDDGRGIAPGTPAGVGLLAMRERALEVGGSCELTAADLQGTRLLARLPLGTGSTT
ncbi:MAG TPA: sensor histidine kinase, partial [Kofleriaceae bacterium]|nr:sensor histidine kinase [Kofleriaceae bacterium]